MRDLEDLWAVAGVTSTQYMYPDGNSTQGEAYSHAKANLFLNAALNKARIMGAVRYFEGR